MSPHAKQLRFVTFDHPQKLKDRKVLTENRRHVMHDYLTQAGRTPMRRRPTVTRPSQSPQNATHQSPKSSARRRHHRSRRRSRPGALAESTPPAYQPASSLRMTSGATTDTNISPLKRTSPDLELRIDPTPQIQPLHIYSITDSTPTMPASVRGTDSPLIHAPSGFLYRRTSFSDVPFPPGSPINPFKTWPCLREPLNTTKLKYSCSKYFGTEMLARSWVPTLLKARHAFLSSICISAAHDDLMQRAIQAPSDRAPFESTDRFLINAQVCNMINSALNDPDMRIADSTIIAVLQVLSSEIMGCDDSVMAMHQKGLHVMIQQRGGLNSLGVDGKLASVLTITMYMISALRETIPHRDYEVWAGSGGTRPSALPRKIPESPIFCRSSGYDSLKNLFSPDSQTFGLLESLRLLTKDFVRASGLTPFSPLSQVDASTTWEPGPRARLFTQHSAIFALPPAASHPAFYTSSAPTRTSDNAKYTYEAVRLTALIWAYALNNDLSLSTAAATLSANQPHSIHDRIKRSLLRTDLSACWGDAAGLLFWITLVASAAANPACATHNNQNTNMKKNSRSDNDNANNDDTDDDDDELSRKWLAAVAVRCSIVLGFEHGPAVLETLKRLVGLEQVLAARAAAAAAAATATTNPTGDLQQQVQQPQQNPLHEDGIAIPGSGISLNSPLLPHELCRPLIPTERPLAQQADLGFLAMQEVDGGGHGGVGNDGNNRRRASTFARADGAAATAGMDGIFPDDDFESTAAAAAAATASARSPVFGPEDVPFWLRRANFADFADDFRDEMD